MINYDRLKSWHLEPVTQRFTARDTIIYNLGIGAGVIANSSEASLDLLWEERLVAPPTMATVLGIPPYWLDDPRAGIDWRFALHSHEAISIHRPLPAEGEIRAVSRVEEVYDKGSGKAALLILLRDITDAKSDVIYATVRTTLFLRGSGGFRGPTAVPSPTWQPERDPDRVVYQRTRPELAPIFRLSGDTFDLHIDPDFARLAGFDGPILHGLSTFGLVGLVLVQHLCAADYTRVRHVAARFSAPMYPGEPICVEIWNEGAGRSVFQCFADGRPVLTNGIMLYE